MIFLFMLRDENFKKCGIFDKKMTGLEVKNLNRQAVYSICEVLVELRKQADFNFRFGVKIYFMGHFHGNYIPG